MGPDLTHRAAEGKRELPCDTVWEYGMEKVFWGMSDFALDWAQKSSQEQENLSV